MQKVILKENFYQFSEGSIEISLVIKVISKAKKFEKILKSKTRQKRVGEHEKPEQKPSQWVSSRERSP